MTIFDAYNKENYLAWHNENVEGGANFEGLVTAMRDTLMAESEAKLEVLGQLLFQIKSRTEPEVRLQSRGLLSGEFDLPTKDFSKAFQHRYELLFKSTDSIIEKCWRKNALRKENFVGSVNMRAEITDLIRTSVICPTLAHAKMFTERLEAWRDYIPEDEIRNHFSTVRAVQVDKEAKPSSGYFAYHSLITISDDVPIEVQFYSVLSGAWRAMSHKLYEKTRVGESPVLHPGAPASRLISLGHLLHLAEYEVERLVEDLQARH